MLEPGPIEAAREMLGLTIQGLWLDYVALGGNLTSSQLIEYLEGRLHLRRIDYDVLVQAINERFLDRGMDHPMAYAEDLLN